MKERKQCRKSYLAFHTKKALEYVDNGNINLAQRILNEVLEKYPDDYMANNLQARILHIRKAYDLSFDLLEYNYMCYFFKTIAVIYLNDYEKMTEMYNMFFKGKRPEDNGSEEYSYAFYKIKKRLETILNTNDGLFYPCTYSIEQTADYSKENSIKHIVENHYNIVENKSYFYNSINIEYLFNKTRELINENRRNSTYDDFTDTYIFHYPKCGVDKDNNMECDYFIVATNMNSDEIISMYPVYSAFKYQKVIEFEENTYTSSKQKVKSKSQIDKFNERYKK